jgi:hypothetical protein
VIRNLYSALRIDNSTPTLTPNLKKHPLYQINLLILKYNVEQNDLHLVTFALPLCRSTKKKRKAIPQLQNLHQNSKCDLLRRDEIGSSSQ